MMNDTATDLSFFGDWYTAGLAELDRCSKSPQLFVDILGKLSKETGLDKCVSCISIGPGSGAVDVPLIKSHMPQLKEYYGVEPRPDAVCQMKKLFKTNLDASVQGIFNQCKAENWEGPPGGSKVDVVLALEVLYHIDDKQAFFRKCSKWLRPGGVLYVIHGSAGLFHQIALELGSCEEQLYISKHIPADLEAVGLTQWKDYDFHAEINLTDRQQPLIDFLLQKSATPQEVDQLNGIIDKLAPSGSYSEPGKLFVVRI